MPEVYKSSGGGQPAPKTNQVQEPVAEQAPQAQSVEMTPAQEARQVIEDVLRKTGSTKRQAMAGAYIVKPEKRFVNEQEDEEVVLLLRAHPITNIKWIMTAVLMLILPGVLEVTGAFAMVPGNLFFAGKLMWYLVTLGFAFEKFLNWYYSVFIITNERMVDIDFVNLLYRVVSYANLNHIEEPTMAVGGILRSMFRYGDVHVSTAAEKSTLEALAVPYPDKVVNIISQLSEELEKRRERGE